VLAANLGGVRKARKHMCDRCWEMHPGGDFAGGEEEGRGGGVRVSVHQSSILEDPRVLVKRRVVVVDLVWGGGRGVRARGLGERREGKVEEGGACCSHTGCHAASATVRHKPTLEGLREQEDGQSLFI
jgi:hypothetical protein